MLKYCFDNYHEPPPRSRQCGNPSGPIQEGFAYAYHYGSYILSSWPSVLADFQDERFQKVYDRIHTWFSYTLAEELVPAGPWCA